MTLTVPRKDPAAWGAIWVVTMMPFVVAAPRAAAETPIDRLFARLDKDSSIPDEAKALIRSTWSECDDCDAAEFLTQGLAVMAPAFRRGLDAYDADDYRRCVHIMSELREDSSPFVATNAAAYEVKALVALDMLREAKERIGALTADGGADLANYSYFSAEMAFLRAYCLVAELSYDEATKALQGFLADYPEAPQRLTLSAKQMLAELANRQPERIGEVADLMDYSHRRLSNRDSGEIVQGKQQRIIDLLDNLIEEAEQKEKQQSSSSSGSSGNPKNNQLPQNPMPDSRLPGGDAGKERLRDGRRANPAEMWGAMPPAQREQVLQALRESFPQRYRQLVEQYYEELAKKP